MRRLAALLPLRSNLGYLGSCLCVVYRRLGHALHIKDNIRQVDLRRPFKSMHPGEKPIDDFLQERPRIRRQTFQHFSKGLMVRVQQPLVRRRDLRRRRDAEPQPGVEKEDVRQASGVFDPNRASPPFSWAEVSMPHLNKHGIISMVRRRDLLCGLHLLPLSRRLQLPSVFYL